MAQLLNNLRPPTPTPLYSPSTHSESPRSVLQSVTRHQSVDQDWASRQRKLRCNGKVSCLFSDNRRQEQARKALDNALGGKKSEFEKWNKEIEKREEVSGGGDTGGGGWFGWGRRFGWYNGDHFWQEAQQTSLAVLGIIVMGNEVEEKTEVSETKTASKTNAGEDNGHEPGENMSRTMSENSIYVTEDEEDDEGRKIELGPQFTLKEQLEKDKDDESLRRWKEQLLGSVDMTSVGETLEPEVKILSLAIKSPGRSDIILPIPESGNPKGLWFTLKEGSRYSLNFTFQVSNNIVSGLKYTNTVWKTGVKVDSAKEMLGTFSPQPEPYTHEMPEETTPSGIFARGSYSAKSKFVDDDNKCYLEINYTFDIRKDWLSS